MRDEPKDWLKCQSALLKNPQKELVDKDSMAVVMEVEIR